MKPADQNTQIRDPRTAEDQISEKQIKEPQSTPETHPAVKKSDFLSGLWRIFSRKKNSPKDGDHHIYPLF